MNYRLSPTVQGVNYVFDYQHNFITGVRVTASQAETGDTQAAAFLTVPIEITVSQAEAGDTQLVAIVGPTAITFRMYAQDDRREMMAIGDQRKMSVA